MKIRVHSFFGAVPITHKGVTLYTLIQVHHNRLTTDSALNEGYVSPAQLRILIGERAYSNSDSDNHSIPVRKVSYLPLTIYIISYSD